MLHAKLLQRQVTLKKRPAVSPQPRVSARLQPALVSSYSIRNQVHYVKSTTFSLYKTQNDLGSFARGRFQLVKYSTSQELIPPQTEPHRTKLTVSERWRLTKERFQKKKLQFTVEYGSTFIFLHELLGISSYLTVFSLIHFNVINVDTILGLFGWDEAYLMERFGIDAHGLFTKWALTIATVKGLDALGLVPLRWSIAIFLTPRVAFFIGPKLDKIVETVKKRIGKPSTQRNPP